MSQNSLNDLSKVYLDKVSDFHKAQASADKQRWEDLGGPTPGNYKPLDDSAQLKTEDKEVRRLSVKESFSESFSDWRNDLFEGPHFKTEKDAEKRISEKKGINNEVIINPKLDEAIKEIGGELLEAQEIEEEFDAAVEYFYAEGINEEGIDLIIEEVGLDNFVDFITDSEFLTEAKKRVPGGGPYPAKKMNVRTLKATQKKAQEIKADKSDVVKKAGPKDILSRARTERALKKRKLAKPAPKKEAPKPVAKKPAPKPAPKPVAKKDFDGDGKKETPKAEHRGVRNKAITKAVAKAKPAQPKKPASKEGIRAKVKAVYDAGVKRHRKATQPVRVFHKGMKAGAKKAVKFAKDVKKVVSEKLDYDPMDDPDFDHDEAEKKRGVSGKNNPKGGKKLKDLTKEEKEKCECDCGQDPCIKCGESHHDLKEDALTSRQQMLQRKQLVLDKQKLQLRRRSQSQAKKSGSVGSTNADAQADTIKEAKVDTGSADEKAKARNLRNTPPGADKDTDLKTFITRKPGESLDKARQRVRQRQHAARRGVKEEVIDETVSPGVSRQLRNVGRKQRSRFAKGAGRVHTGGSQALDPQHTARSTRVVDTSRDAQTGVDSVSGEYKSAEQRKREHKANVARQRASGASMRGEGFSNWREDLLEDAALDKVKADIIKKHGERSIHDPERDKPTEAQKKAAAAERQKRQAEKNKAFADRAKKAGYKNPQDYANVVARYGSEENMKKGKGLGT